MVTLDTFLHGLKKFAVKETSDFGSSFKPDFQTYTMTATTTRQLIMLPQTKPVEMSWLGITVRSTTIPGTTRVYFASTVSGEGKELPMALAYYERGTDHRPVQAQYYTVWTNEGEATVEIDGEWW